MREWEEAPAGSTAANAAARPDGLAIAMSLSSRSYSSPGADQQKSRLDAAHRGRSGGFVATLLLSGQRQAPIVGHALHLLLG